MGGCLSAKGVVKYLGSAKDNIKWGHEKVGLGLALVDVMDVLLPLAKVPLKLPGWRQDTTLQDALQHIQTLKETYLLFHLSSLRIVLNPTELTEEALDTEQFIQDSKQSAANVDEHQTILKEGDLLIRRGKKDIFHVFHAMPLPRKFQGTQLLIELMIAATWQFYQEDYDDVTNFLASKGVDDFSEHFMFNIEWWKKRVRMLTPEPARHASNMITIKAFVEKQFEELPQDLLDYIEKVATHAERGDFQMIRDMHSFHHIGIDGNGLNLYVTNRGTNLNENFHQKLKVSIGPWAVGAASAHIIMNLLTLRSNVHARIKRHGDPNHGHPYLWFIDKIQIKLQSLFGFSLYSDHINVYVVKDTKFLPIGIGPLSNDSRFVECGKASPNLKGDLAFVAEKMGLVFPLIPMSTIDEMKLFTKHIKKNKDAITDRDMINMAIVFKEQSDGKTIFPKLPDMLMAHYQKWKLNQTLKLMKMKMKECFNETKKKLFSTVNVPPKRNAPDQGMDGLGNDYISTEVE